MGANHHGLGFDVATMLDRRRALALIGAGAASFGLAACGDPTSSGSRTAESATSSTSSSSASSSASAAGGATTVTEEIPEETAGPYPGDGSNGPDALEHSGIVRSDIRASFGTSTTVAQGVPMTLQLTIADLANGASGLAGAAVYVWHCDRDGNYSMYSDGVTGENYLRGVQITDELGKVTFTSIVPACYSGRWPHIHFEVYPNVEAISDSANAIATSQVALPQSLCETVYATSGYEQSVRNLNQVSLSQDNVFGDDSGALQLATTSGDVASGYTISLVAGVHPSTAPAAVGGGPAGGMPGRVPGGAPPKLPPSQ